jgi:hypothetical protein
MIHNSKLAFDIFSLCFQFMNSDNHLPCVAFFRIKKEKTHDVPSVCDDRLFFFLCLFVPYTQNYYPANFKFGINCEVDWGMGQVMRAIMYVGVGRREVGEYVWAGPLSNGVSYVELKESCHI